ncbi:MAG: hypothetical protein FJ100_17175 [Deltaproteobacteria bacterium]|nr:hypothetical protein [Deltaproteobacteria bacterium]
MMCTRNHSLLIKLFTALPLVGACAGTSTGGSGGGSAAADANAAGDTKLASDGSIDAATLQDGKGADGPVGDAAPVDGGSTADAAAVSADLPVQDTGRSKDDIAKNLSDAKKAEGDFYLAYCKLNFNCPTGMQLTHAEACKAELLATGGVPPFDEGLRAVAAGTAKFDAAKAAACQATLDANCTFFKAVKLPAACKGLFVGLVDNGFACTADIACKSGYCKTKDINDAECPGLCAAPAKAGAACNSDSGCEGDNVCTAADKCGPYVLAKKGEDCADVDCVDGLKCLEDFDSYTCFEPKALGSACWVGEDACAQSAYCQTADTESEGKCKAKVAIGKACDKDAWYDGLSENPCTKDHVCVELPANATTAVCAPVVALGQPCASSDQCKGLDEICDGPAGKEVCAYLPKKGEACDPPDEEVVQAGLLSCLPPFVCDAKTSKCIDLPVAGKPCAEFFKCALDLYCTDSDTCSAYGKAGEDCTSFEGGDSTCDAGLICGAKNEKCVAPVCK